MPSLVAIPDAAAWRREAIRQAGKWDPQVGDHDTVAPVAVILSAHELHQLAALVEVLARETAALEAALLVRPDLWSLIALPSHLARALRGRCDPPHLARLMRFDMHPLASGWALSEVNADVPGGMNEAGPLCRLAVRYLGRRPPPDPQAAIADACAARLGRGARIALVHATSYSDDRQQMEGLADALASVGLRGEPCAPDHVHEGRLRLAGREGQIAGIVRFFPAEWLPNLPSAAWTSWRDDWCTPACNHMAAALVQSKRLPLAWDALGLDLPAWRSVSPPCRTPRWRDDPAWVRKPAWGRVGGGVGIAEAISRDESRRIRWSARLHPRWWVEQERFASSALAAAGAGPPQHLALGCFAVDGRFAGCYARISAWPRIDERAADAPVLVED